jgi:hypothetical protein
MRPMFLDRREFVASLLSFASMTISQRARPPCTADDRIAKQKALALENRQG